MLKLNRVISVCAEKDLDTFCVASSLILQNIEADNYLVIVPKSAVEVFVNKVPENICVISEEKYSDIRSYLLSSLGANQARFGWYFQQFIKLSELINAEEDTLNLLWDADTIPLRPLSFSSDDKVKFYTGTECHKPYFDLISRLFGIHKQASYSFIAQCFPCKKKWINHFVDELETRHAKKWWEAVIDEIDFTEECGFSEYETLGNYILSNFESEMVLSSRNWLRDAGKLPVVSSMQKQLEKYSLDFDFVSYEKDHRRYKGFYGTLLKKYHKFSGKL